MEENFGNAVFSSIISSTLLTLGSVDQSIDRLKKINDLVMQRCVDVDKLVNKIREE